MTTNIIWCLFAATLSFAGPSAPARSTATPSPQKLVILGDSLTEGFGVSRERAYPALLQQKIDASGKKWQVVNSGISGSTSASAPARVDWILKQKPQIILLALGANDGLRGTDLKSLEANLASAIQKCQAAKVKVILAGMRIPPNYGAAYGEKFAALFPKLAKRFNIPLIPFLLEGVGGRSDLNLADGIHPNENGHEIMAQTVFKSIEKYL